MTEKKKRSRRKTKRSITSSEIPPQETRRKIIFDPSLGINYEYWATDTGEIYEIGWNKQTNRMRYFKLNPLKYGGHREGIKDMDIVRLSGSSKKVGVHILVWCAWNGVAYDGLRKIVVEHINGDVVDNRPKNLKFKTKNGRVISFKGTNGNNKKVVIVDDDLAPKYKTEKEYIEEYEKLIEEAGTERKILKQARLRDKVVVDNSIDLPSTVESEFLPEIEEKIVQYIKAGAFLETAILAAGVSRPVYRSWITEAKRSPEGRFGLFMKRVEEAMSQAEVLLASKVTNAASRHWQAATWLLEKKHPMRWKNQTHVTDAGAPGDQVIDASKGLDLTKLSIEELKFLRELYSKQGKEMPND